MLKNVGKVALYDALLTDLLGEIQDEIVARGLNHLLRKRGLTPAAPGRWPASNAARSFGFRVLRKLGLAG